MIRVMTTSPGHRAGGAEPGRRAAHKRATRQSLLAAARHLFAERGFEATTVRDIAAEARVTERTFYRYFDGKTGLLTDSFDSWLSRVAEAITARPPDEAPLVAVEEALAILVHELMTGTDPAGSWLAGNEQHYVRELRRTGTRPLLRLESAIAAAILTRLRSRQDPGFASPDNDEYAAQVLARVAVAALRSAISEYRLRSPKPRPGDLLHQAFAAITAGLTGSR